MKTLNISLTTQFCHKYLSVKGEEISTSSAQKLRLHLSVVQDFKFNDWVNKRMVLKFRSINISSNWHELKSCNQTSSWRKRDGHSNIQSCKKRAAASWTY